MAKAKNQNHKTNESEEKCFHDYVEHLKRLQGGDYKSSITENRFSLKYPSGSELAAFLDIGAEAERRNEVQFQEMNSCIDNLTKENDCLRKENMTKTNTVISLQKKLAENENVIVSLTSEIDQLNCRLIENRNVQNLRAQYECEREQILKEKEDICCQLRQLKWKFCKLKEDHNCCATNEQLEAKDCKINYLTEYLKEKDKNLQNISNEMKDLNEKKRLLEMKVNSLEDQLQSQYDQFAEKNCIYQKTIDDLESQVSFLERALTNKQHTVRYRAFISKLKDRLYDKYKKEASFMTENDNCKNNETFQEIIGQPIQLQETYNANLVCERDRILQELVAKIELRDKNVLQLMKLQNSPHVVSDKEYNVLMKLMDEQTCEIDRLTNELQNKSLDDTDSVELLNEISELQTAIHDPSAGCQQDIDPLARRIKRIRCKIKSRLLREEARRKELSRQLGIYRCYFITTQKEIDELRQANASGSKDDVRTRLEKEKALSQVICHVNRQRRELTAKCVSLAKALANIEKVNEFLMHLS